MKVAGEITKSVVFPEGQELVNQGATMIGELVVMSKRQGIRIKRKKMKVKTFS
jgi:hypothetical protein